MLKHLLVTGLVAVMTGCAHQGPFSGLAPQRTVGINPPRVDMTGLLPETDGKSFDHAIFNQFLSEVLRSDGTVDFARAQELQIVLDGYLKKVANSHLGALSHHEQLALCLNAHNAFTIRLILKHPEITSLLDIPRKELREQARWVLAGRIISFEDLEYSWIRMGFREPLALFGMYMGTAGGPPMPATAFTGDNLLEQLELQAIRFLGREHSLYWESETGSVYLSALLDWYEQDFMNGEGGILSALLPYMPRETADAIVQASPVSLYFMPFDWSLDGSW